MSNILVTGATGLVGSQLCRRLQAQGDHVLALSRQDKTTVTDHLKWIKGDLRDISAIEEHIAGCDAIFHAGAIVSFKDANADEIFEINIQGTAELVNLCLKYQIKMCFISSVAAIGRPSGQHLIDEDTKWEPSPLNTRYAISKYKAELEVWRGIMEGMDAVIINPSTILGIGDWNTTSLQLYKYVFEGKKYYTTGTINFVDVRDVADAAVAAYSQGRWGERFIISGGHLKYEGLFNKMAKYLGVPPPSKELTPKLGQIGWRLAKVLAFFTGKPSLMSKETVAVSMSDHVYAASKAQQVLGMNFKSLDDTLQWSCQANIGLSL